MSPITEGFENYRATLRHVESALRELASVAREARPCARVLADGAVRVAAEAVRNMALVAAVGGSDRHEWLMDCVRRLQEIDSASFHEEGRYIKEEVLHVISGPSSQWRHHKAGEGAMMALIDARFIARLGAKEDIAYSDVSVMVKHVVAVAVWAVIVGDFAADSGALGAFRRREAGLALLHLVTEMYQVVSPGSVPVWRSHELRSDESLR
jgi:hypothetical protein